MIERREVRASRSESLAVRRKLDGQDRVGVRFEQLKQSVGFYIPQPDGPVITGTGKRRAIRTEPNNVYRRRVTFQDRMLATSLHIPEPDGPVGAATGDDRSVGREGNAADFLSVSRERPHELAGGGIPESYGFIPPCGREKFAVRREGNARDRARMSAQLQRDAHFAEIPNGYDATFARRGHPAASRVERNGIHCRRLKGKLAVRMAERRTGIVVRTARDWKWSWRAREWNTAGEAKR